MQAAALLLAAGLLAACGDDLNVPRPTEPASTGPIDIPVGGPARPLGVADGPRFSGVAHSNIGAGSCSGSFIVPSGVDLEQDGPAYLLTAGHCIQGIGDLPNDVILAQDLDQNRRASGSASSATRRARPSTPGASASSSRR